MMKRLRKVTWLALLPAFLTLGGCQIFGVAAGIVGSVLNFALPLALSVGGAVGVYYLTKDH